MNYLTTSAGERISRNVFDKRIRDAKQQRLEFHFEKYGYHFCTECFRNDDKPIDCSHIESVADCIKNGYPEKAYSVDNIQLLGRRCHNKYDGLNIMSAKIEQQ